MGHQHHFLSRLDRVSAPQVELALSLYRDVDLLRYILANARLPEGAERAALSLDDPARGPFLVVTRDGKFVTCLGAGMSSGDLPVITRGQLDGIAAKASVLRERMELCKKLSGERGGTAKLLRRIYDAADELSREEFLAISALQPVYADEFIKYLYASASDIGETRDILVRALRKSDRLKPQYHSMLRSYWKHLWAIGHLSVLSTMDGRGILDVFSPQVLAEMEKAPFSWAAVRQGVLGLALKGAWSVGRLGKVLLPSYKKSFVGAISHLTITNSLVGLLVLAMRHARLSAEIEKTLAGGLHFPDEPTRQLMGPFAKAILDIADHALKEPEACSLIQRSVGARMAIDLGAHLPAGDPYRFERMEDVPPDLAMTLAVNDQSPFLSFRSGDKNAMTSILYMILYLPWVARAAPESLYMTADYMKVIHSPWRPEQTLRILRVHRDYYQPPRPDQAKGPARKGPCPCGSGKKYKRCCGVGDDNDGNDDSAD